MKRNAQTNAKRTAKRAAMPRGECGATAWGRRCGAGAAAVRGLRGSWPPASAWLRPHRVVRVPAPKNWEACDGRGPVLGPGLCGREWTERAEAAAGSERPGQKSLEQAVGERGSQG